MTMCRPLQPPDLRVGERVSDFAASEGWIHALAIDCTDTARYAFISDEKVVAEWQLDAETGEAVKRAVYVGHDHRVTSACIGPDGSLFTGCWDNFVRMFTRPFLGDDPAAPLEAVQIQPVLTMYHPGVFVMSLQVLNGLVYSGCGDGKVWLWDLKAVASSAGHNLAPDRRVRMTKEDPITQDAPVLTMERSHSSIEQCVARWEGHKAPIVTMCAKDKILYTGSDDETIRWWDLTSGSCTGVLQMDGPIVSLAVGPRQLLAAVGKIIHVIGLKDMSPEVQIDAHYGAVKVVLAADDGTIYSGSVDRTVRQFSEEGVEHVRFRGHDDPVSCLALCKGWLVSCAQDQRCIIWLADSKVGVDHLPNQRLDNVVSGNQSAMSSTNYFNNGASSPVPRQP